MGPHAGRRADAVIAIGTILAVSCRRLVSFEILPNFFKWLASFSFSLYAIHIPVVFVTLAVFQNVGLPTHKLSAGPTAFAEFTLCVAIAIAVACVFSLATERQTDVLRRWLLNRSTKITDAAAPRLIQQP
jgi:peptidoglycan/LPS O-acetylase OafA/YrhL